MVDIETNMFNHVSTLFTTAGSTVLYRSPSQGSPEFDNFLSGFENMLNAISSFNPDFPIILGDFNARSKS